MKKFVQLLFCLLILIVFVHSSVSAQESNATKKSIVSERSKNMSLYIYEPTLVLKRIYNTVEEAKFSYPEELMISILSCTDELWNEKNHHPNFPVRPKRVEHYSKVKQSDIDVIYFELDYKLSYSYNGSDFAMIKYFIHSDESEKPASAMKVLEKYNGSWVVSNNFKTFTPIVLMRIDKYKLKNILNLDASDQLITELLPDIMKNGAVDLDLLAIEFSKWYEEPVNEDSINHFKDPRTW